jgi:hypothetical protein
MRNPVSNYGAMKGPEPSAPAAAFESCLHQLGVEQDFGVVGEEL